MSIRDRVVNKKRFFAHLRALSASKKTGTLIVTEPGAERRIYFEEGTVVAATSTLREESMGHLLAERDIVKAYKVEQAEDLLGDQASLLGRKLVELGAMSEDEIVNAVRLKVRETISNILANPEAEIVLNDEKFPDIDRVPVSIDVDQLLSAGIEAAEKKVVTRDREETPAVGTTEEEIALEPEPEPKPEPKETFAPVDETDDPDSHLMDALEGFTEKYSLEPTVAPRTAGPITKPYATVPEQTASSPGKSTGTFPVGIIAAGVLGVALLGGGYWFFTRSGEQPATRPAARVETPSITEQTVPPEPAEASPEPAEPSTPDVAASLTPQAPPRAPSRSTPAAPPSRTPPARQPVQRPAAAPPPQPAPARPAPRQQAPTPPPVQTNPAPANPEPVPEPEPPANPPVAETEPSSPPPGDASPETPEPSVQAGQAGQAGQVVQPPQAEEAQPGEAADWGSTVFAPKQATATASSTPSNPGLQTGDYVEPSFDVIEPVLIEHPKLRYPDEAKRQKIPEAVVRVRVLVDHTGAVQDTEIVKGAGHGFDEVALAAAVQAKFIPATKGRVQVKTWTILPLVFRLDD